MAETDSRGSLRHILGDDSIEATPRASATASPQVPHPEERAASAERGEDEQQEVGGDRGVDADAEADVAGDIDANGDGDGRGDGDVDGDDDDRNKDQQEHQYTSTTTTTRRNANGSVSSVFSGNKIRHLKKDDGVPLWRKDIQFDFLQLIFADERRVFTCYSDKTTGHTFSEVYLDAMSKSSKTSKILKEKLAQDHDSAIAMAMVCLLVNVGRMNTTLNFFPEMRAQLRTYHSVPALQARQDPTAYKQLQDAPRLKSILKGASEDEPQPNTMEEVRKMSVPRTNPVNLIFVLSQYAPKISEMHFAPPIDFFDLVMRPTLSSETRARSFLWLLWWYLESDFSAAAAENNPFGPGTEHDGPEGVTYRVPTLDTLTDEEAALENVDTEEELAFGESKRLERLSILSSDPSPAMTALKRAKKGRDSHPHMGSDNEDRHASPGGFSDSARTPSPPPRKNGGRGTSRASHAHDEKTPASGSGQKLKLGRGKLRLSNKKGTPLAERMDTEKEPRSGRSAGSRKKRDPRVTDLTLLKRQERPLTSLQAGLNAYRRFRLQQYLNGEIRDHQAAARKSNDREGVILRAWKRIKMLGPDYDSEEEEDRHIVREPDEDALTANGATHGTGKEIKSENKDIQVAAKFEQNPRLVGGVWMGGFMVPNEDGTMAEPNADDCGELNRHYGVAFLRAQNLFERLGNMDQQPLPEPVVLGQRKSEFDEGEFDDAYELVSAQREEAVTAAAAAQEATPVASKRGGRKSGANASSASGRRGGRKSRGGGSLGGKGSGKRKSTKSAVLVSADDDADELDELARDIGPSSKRRKTDAATATSPGDDEDVQYEHEARVPTPTGRLDSEDRELLGELDEGEDADGDGDADADADGDGDEGRSAAGAVGDDDQEAPAAGDEVDGHDEFDNGADERADDNRDELSNNGMEQ